MNLTILLRRLILVIGVVCAPMLSTSFAPALLPVAVAEDNCGTIGTRIDNWTTRANQYNSEVDALNAQGGGTAAQVQYYDGQKATLETERSDLLAELDRCQSAGQAQDVAPPSGLGQKGSPFAPQSNPQNSPTPPSNWNPNWTTGKSGDSVGNAVKHYSDHSSEFPTLKTPQDYVDAATSFYNNPPAGTFRITRPDGGIAQYDPASNTFLAAESSGAIRTMFKPELHLQYWLDNVAASPGQTVLTIIANIQDVMG